jgi:hypothetical protein
LPLIASREAQDKFRKLLETGRIHRKIHTALAAAGRPGGVKPMTRPPHDREREREALSAALAAEARSTGTDGPEPEKLLDFLAGRLDPEEEERLSRYLMTHPEANRALVDLETAGAEAGKQSGKRPAGLAAVAGWRDLERRLHNESSRRFQTLLPAFAAALLVVTAGLSAWVWQLRGELSRPVANLRSLQLSEVRAGTQPAAEIAPGVPLRLVIRPVVRCSGYEAVLEGPRPGDRLAISKLAPDEMGLLTPLLYPEPGSYDLRLYGCDPRQEVGTYGFTVKRDGDEDVVP